MEHPRTVATPEPERAPPFFNVIARSEHVTEARAVDWNVSGDDVATLLYEIDGDAERLATATRETSGIESVELAHGDPGYALAEARPSATPDRSRPRSTVRRRTSTSGSTRSVGSPAPSTGRPAH